MQSPHDKLFHFTFRHAAHAASWLLCIVPPRIRDAIDWSTLAPADERLPGLRLRPHIADRVFTAALRDGSGHVLIVIEHKSYRSTDADSQLLRYSVLLQNAFQQRYGELPLVLAVLLQHGEPAGPFTVRSAADPFAEWQPSLQFVVVDLTRCEEAELLREGPTPLVRLSLLCMRFLAQLEPDDVPRAFDRWQDLLCAVDRADAPPLTPPMGRYAIDTIGWYALAVTNVTPEILSETFCRILLRPDDIIMSTLERTYQKGMAEGEARGEARGRADTLLRMLHKRFAPLDAHVEQRVRAGSTAELDAWTDRILDASSISEVLDS